MSSSSAPPDCVIYLSSSYKNFKFRIQKQTFMSARQREIYRYKYYTLRRKLSRLVMKRLYNNFLSVFSVYTVYYQIVS